MLIRLYVDEDAMARGLVTGLRARGIDVLTVFEAGMSERNDREQLEYSAGLGRVLYSFNVGDFCTLHKEFVTRCQAHAGVVVVYRQRYSIGEQIRRLSNLAHAKSAEDMCNILHFL
jgi:hypothetical protein